MDTKGRGFSSWSGHITRLQVQSPVGTRTRRQPVDISLSHQCFSLSLSKAMKKRPQVRIKKKSMVSPPEGPLLTPPLRTLS